MARSSRGVQASLENPASTFWTVFPDHRRYILSLVSHDGFSKSRVVRDHVISFRDDGQEDEIRFMRPVAGSGKAWNLYVFDDATYEPNPQPPPC